MAPAPSLWLRWWSAEQCFSEWSLRGRKGGLVRGQRWHLHSICMSKRRVLTVATEVATGLVVGQSRVTARFALCWHKRRYINFHFNRCSFHPRKGVLMKVNATRHKWWISLKRYFNNLQPVTDFTWCIFRIKRWRVFSLLILLSMHLVHIWRNDYNTALCCIPAMWSPHCLDVSSQWPFVDLTTYQLWLRHTWSTSASSGNCTGHTESNRSNCF